MRPTSPQADEILNIPFRVLDNGFVALIDYMGNNTTVATDARRSYQQGTTRTSTDERLTTRLYEDRHTSPFEMVELKFFVSAPIVVVREWFRHRTACLAGATRLHFDLPGGISRRGSQLYTLSVKEVFDRFRPTTNSRPDKQKNPYNKRDRVQKMRLRCMDEATKCAARTTITDIWESGEKEVFRITLDNGDSAVMSEDHLCYTENGWLPIKVACSHFGAKDVKIWTIGAGVGSGVTPEFNAICEQTEEWRPVVGWESLYAVSNQGRVKRVAFGRGVPRSGGCKKLTVSVDGYAVVSLSRGGVCGRHHVHKLVLEAFVGAKLPGQEVCHIDGNGLNNNVVNLRWGTPQSNANDRVLMGATTKLKGNLRLVRAVECLGVQMTYDLEVAGPWHNFSAGGLVVHNSINELSGRYSEIPDEFFIPESFRLQSPTNRQGSHGDVVAAMNAKLRTDYLNASGAAHKLYSAAMEAGVAREHARICLPVNIYTNFVWKIDLHNFLHFCGLRRDKAAMSEIREYAHVMFSLAETVAPAACAAFMANHPSMYGGKFNKDEMAALRQMTSNVGLASWKSIPLNILASVQDKLEPREVESRPLHTLTRLPSLVG